MMARIPESWINEAIAETLKKVQIRQSKPDIEYSFRFHSYDSVIEDDSDRERWWINSKYGVAWTHCYGDVNVDVKEAMELAKEENVDFDNVLSNIISHELLHTILLRISSDANNKFDKICYLKNPFIKEWFGGMA